MEKVLSYFDCLDEVQIRRIELLKSLYEDWNIKINVISRKDVENFYERHVLHSLSIAKVFKFSSSDKILDIGTGGGFPGIPLAILFPNTEFHLIDSIGKKINVVEAVVEELKLNNVVAKKSRAEDYKLDYNYVVTRAVAPCNELIKWSGKRFLYSKGIIALKGGDIQEELSVIDAKYNIYNINKYYKEEFFDTKKIVHLYA